MIVGVPKEIKSDEYRVAMRLVGSRGPRLAGHTVLIEAGMRQGSGIAGRTSSRRARGSLARRGPDLDGSRAGDQGRKEPQPLGVPQLVSRPAQVLFTIHRRRFGPPPGPSSIAVSRPSPMRRCANEGALPLLTPMSEVAGRMSIQEGAKYLERPQEGRGILLSGVPGVAPAEVAILGGGVVGSNAAKVAAGLGANVRILDINLDRLRYLDDIMPPNVTTLYSDRHTIIESIERADLVIGAILITGARAPRLVRREDLARMKNGAVIVDVVAIIDQGGLR